MVLVASGSIANLSEDKLSFHQVLYFRKLYGKLPWISSRLVSLRLIAHPMASAGTTNLALMTPPMLQNFMTAVELKIQMHQAAPQIIMPHTTIKIPCQSPSF